MIYGRLLPHANAAMNLLEGAVVHHLEEHQSSLDVQGMLVGGVLLLLVEALGAMLLTLGVIAKGVEHLVGETDVIGVPGDVPGGKTWWEALRRRKK